MKQILAFWCEHPDGDDYSHPTSAPGRSRITAAITTSPDCPKAIPLVAARRWPGRRVRPSTAASPRVAISVDDRQPVTA